MGGSIGGDIPGYIHNGRRYFPLNFVNSCSLLMIFKSIKVWANFGISLIIEFASFLEMICNGKKHQLLPFSSCSPNIMKFKTAHQIGIVFDRASGIVFPRLVESTIIIP